MPLTDYLDQILEWHTRHNSPVARLIQPGLGEDEILSKISHLPFQLPREFVGLYRWRNGVPLGTSSSDTSLFVYHRFLPLDEAIEAFQTCYPIMKMFYEITDFVPTFLDPAGDGYGILRASGKEESAPIVFLFEGQGIRIVFDSLTQMMKTMVACFEEGVFSWGKDELQTDFDRLGQVARRLNPSNDFWKDYVG